MQPELIARLAALDLPQEDLFAALAAWAHGQHAGPLAPWLASATPEPATFGHVHAARRQGREPDHAVAQGVVYTPLDIAARLTDLAFDRVAGVPRLLDPACGGGVFLVLAARHLWRRADARTPAQRVACLRRWVRGWDVDADAVHVARLALAAAAGAQGADLTGVVEVRDALAQTAPDEGSFDLVVGNPPWVDSVRHRSTRPAERAALSARYEAASGNWDLFCPFIERALTLTRPGGVHAFVVPDKLASAPYAAVARRMLHGGAHVHDVVDLREAPLGAQARAIAYVATRSSPSTTRWHGPDGTRTLRLPVDGAPWPLFGGQDPRSPGLAGARPLASLALVTGAATVAEAYAWRDALRTGTPDATLLPVLNSGTIDPWRPLWDARPLRYLGRQIARPVVPVEVLSPRRLALARAPKLVLASMTRRLEAIADLDGAWVGAKSTTLVVPHAPADLPWLAAWLASEAADRLYRARFGGLSFRGDHLRVGPPQLRQLPVPCFDAATRARLGELARHLTRRPDDDDAQRTLDDEVDAFLAVAPR